LRSLASFFRTFARTQERAAIALLPRRQDLAYAFFFPPPALLFFPRIKAVDTYFLFSEDGCWTEELRIPLFLYLSHRLRIRQQESTRKNTFPSFSGPSPCLLLWVKGPGSLSPPKLDRGSGGKPPLLFPLPLPLRTRMRAISAPAVSFWNSELSFLRFFPPRFSRLSKNLEDPCKHIMKCAPSFLPLHSDYDAGSNGRCEVPGAMPFFLFRLFYF